MTVTFRPQQLEYLRALLSYRIRMIEREMNNAAITDTEFLQLNEQLSLVMSIAGMLD